MECVETVQQNLLEDKMSSETLMTLHPPEESTKDSEIEDAAYPKDNEVASKSINHENEEKAMNEDSLENMAQLVSSRKCKMIILSDDEDSQSASGTSNLMENDDSIGQKKMRIIGSDSESEEDTSLFNKKPNTEKPKTVYNSDIFDTELSDDDQLHQSDVPNHSTSNLQESENVASGNNKKKEKKVRQSSEKAQQEIRNIHSETQRMVRESRISLPYHRPKQRTLAEFLARRKSTMPPQMKNQSLKMTMRNMEILRMLEEKKKQIDEFYKSDSDSEDPDDQDWTPEKDTSEKDDKLNSPTATEELVEEAVTLPDLTATFNESSAVEKKTEENCPDPASLTSPSVLSSDEGLGASDESTFKENFSPDTSQCVEIAATKNTENNLPVTEDVNSNDNVLENLDAKTGSDDAEGLDNGEAASKEVHTALGEECHQLNTNISISTPKLTPKLKLLASVLPKEELNKILSITPRLNSGKKDDVIDLNECSPLHNPGIHEFKDRFLRHVDIKPKPAKKQEVNLNIVSQQDNGTGEKCLVSSSLLVTVGEDAKENLMTKGDLPGAQFTSFKAALHAKIREQRERHRLKRVQEKQFMETEEIPEDYQNDNLPDEEAELTDQSETDYETESEPEENDVVISDKKREKNCYVDDEADEDEEDVQPQNDDMEEDNGPASDGDDEDGASATPKERKRIIIDPEDDSEEDESKNLTFNWDETQECEANRAAMSHSNPDDLSTPLTCKRGETLDKDASTTSFDSSFELYGSVIAGHQPMGGMKLSAENVLSQSLTKSKSNSFSSTLSNSSRKQQELSLPAEDSVDIFNNEATSVSQGDLDLNFSSLDSTQPHESNTENESFAKLDLDLSRIDSSQDKEELIGLCSGQFSNGTRSATEMKELCEDDISPTQEMNDLLGLCSGHFTGPKKKHNNQVDPQALLASHRDLDGDGLLGLSTSKFTISSDSQTEPCPEESLPEKTEIENRTKSPKLVIYSSEDDDDVDVKARSVRRKKRKRVIEFSDDEDAQEPLAFDDEENEICATVFTGFKDSSKRGIRAEFLENEAELSGSDLNSDDEAEGSDDDMEEEAGDREHFDSNELRDQVGKAHLRSLLDSDKREVRLLQELYLEDGELHGEGRSRQFRWKNLDKSMDDERKTLSEEEGGGSDDNMEESEWRKQKVEREKFLQEQRDKMTEAKLYEDDSWPSVQKLPKDLGSRKPLAPVGPQGVTNSNILFKKQRGSFLNRDRTTLARIAEFTRDRKDVVGGAKQGGNFVFQQLGGNDLQEEVEENEKNTSNHKKTHNLPVVKKAKMDQFSSSRDNNRRSTSIFKHF